MSLEIENIDPGGFLPDLSSRRHYSGLRVRACDANGRCDVFCGQNNLRSIRGRHDNGPLPNDSYAVLLINSPGSIIDRSALCGNYADDGSSIGDTHYYPK